MEGIQKISRENLKNGKDKQVEFHSGEKPLTVESIQNKEFYHKIRIH